MMPDSNMNTGLDAGPVQLGAGRSGAGPGFGGNFDISSTSVGTYLEKVNPLFRQYVRTYIHCGGGDFG